MCLRFVFLLITRVASWLRLSRREEAWQTAEILIPAPPARGPAAAAAAPPERELGGPVGLDYSIAPGQACGLRSSLSDHLSGLADRALPARRPDGAGPA